MGWVGGFSKGGGKGWTWLGVLRVILYHFACAFTCTLRSGEDGVLRLWGF